MYETNFYVRKNATTVNFVIFWCNRKLHRNVSTENRFRLLRYLENRNVRVQDRLSHIEA